MIRDRRRIDPTTGAPREKPTSGAGGASAREGRSAQSARPTHDGGPRAAGHRAAGPRGPRHSGAPATDAGPAEQRDVELEAEVAALRVQLEERTADLQRVQAEYANYRKRVDRDRVANAEAAVGAALTGLLPVLDDLDRAAAHGDLVGPFAAVAEKLIQALKKVGLASFGDPGDPFDPNWHEAVMHSTSPDVTEPTCVEVLGRGYRLGEKMLRPAMVAVADPEPGGAPAADPVAGPDPGAEDGDPEGDAVGAEQPGDARPGGH